MTEKESAPMRVRWARLRFSIVGPLLSAPPELGALQNALKDLSGRSWRHPTTNEAVRFSVPTIERWYYDAKHAPLDPIEALARKIPSHTGSFPSMPPTLLEALILQYRHYPRWSYQLHKDNLEAQVKKDPALGPMPSYGTVCRVMKSHGLFRLKKKPRPVECDFQAREKRSFQAAYVHGLWHLDFHEGSRRILHPSGKWTKVYVLGVLDDRSRLCCHLQWYLEETAEALIHALTQAILKRGLPRALLTDNGSAMIAGETTQGLSRLSIVHETTLPRTPEQNGKQECFWGQVEGRLIAMLEGEKELTLKLLNDATQAWVELEYNRRRHSEIGEPPLDCFLREKSVDRPSPSSEILRRAFRIEESRTQRRSDGTITVKGVRFEIPSRYRTLLRPSVRYARWDLSSVDLVDSRTGAHLATLFPIDKEKNADGHRRPLDSNPEPDTSFLEPTGIAPHLAQLMEDAKKTGLPPAYLTSHEPHTPEEEGDQNP